MHAFEETVKGSNSIPAGFFGGNANLKMYEDSFGGCEGFGGSEPGVPEEHRRV